MATVATRDAKATAWLSGRGRIGMAPDRVLLHLYQISSDLISEQGFRACSPLNSDASDPLMPLLDHM
ncbi:hypothetical protein PVAP13_9KG191500 [Panicum virgatum]|uniref:Uncharacterized protein n=1 Tax=Panicum virgatum TaxID=38727 RepID=A0A8T0NH37_PANVG|nr:hypothetical protein PVAP13_9KG191500 [Panicum virgatum]